MAAAGSCGAECGRCAMVGERRYMLRMSCHSCLKNASSGIVRIQRPAAYHTPQAMQPAASVAGCGSMRCQRRLFLQRRRLLPAGRLTAALSNPPSPPKKNRSHATTSTSVALPCAPQPRCGWYILIFVTLIRPLSSHSHYHISCHQPRCRVCSRRRSTLSAKFVVAVSSVDSSPSDNQSVVV